MQYSLYFNSYVKYGDKTTNALGHMSALDRLTQRRMPALKYIRAYFLN